MFTKLKTPKSNKIAASAPHSAPKVSHPNPTPQHPSHFPAPNRPYSGSFGLQIPQNTFAFIRVIRVIRG